MRKSIASSKDTTSILNQVNHTSVIFDHDSDPSYPSPLMGLAIRRILALPNKTPNIILRLINLGLKMVH